MHLHKTLCEHAPLHPLPSTLKIRYYGQQLAARYTNDLPKQTNSANHWVFSVCPKVVYHTDHLLRPLALRKVERARTTRLYHAHKGAMNIKMTAGVTFREAYILAHLIASLDFAILPPSIKCVLEIAVCHNELAQARHKICSQGACTADSACQLVSFWTILAPLSAVWSYI